MTVPAENNRASRRTLHRRVRLQEVAAQAGVSKSVASRVLNGDPSLSVRAETRERVLAAVQALGYRPDPLARALASSLTGALALLVPSFDNPAYLPIIRGAYQRAREQGFVLLSTEDFDAQRADEAFTEMVEAGRIDGLLIASALPARPLLTALNRHWVPHVFVNRAVPGAVSNLVLDVASASRLALEHLAGLGHVHLGHLAGPANIEAARRRERAFLAAARERGLPSVSVRRGAFSVTAGEASAARLLREHPEITAIYASSFVQAIGALRAATRNNRCVPDDLSVIAYEDARLAEYLSPPLTTIAMPMEKLGGRAVDMLLEQIAGADPTIEVLDGAPRLIERDSIRPPRPTV
jgi:LacI family transcriptional regulator